MLEDLNAVMETGEDDLTEAQPQGVLGVRGLLAKMVNHPSVLRGGPDVGILEHCNKGHTAVMDGCVMDTKRQTQRECYALLVYTESQGTKYALVLDCVDGGTTFQRAGICKAESFTDLGRFSATDVKIV